MPSENQQAAEYRCPGQSYSISRAVHLGRLARFYPGCRQCRHRDDTCTLSRKQVQQLAKVRPRGLPRPLFHAEGAGGVYGNDLGPGVAREMAVALGACLRRRFAAADSSQEPFPVVAIAGDGRPMTCPLVAAVGEGLRWAGCHVVDIGSASAACLAFAIDYLQTSGGILVGNPGDQPQMVGLKFWAPGPQPLSANGALDPLRQYYQTGVDRPTRTFGTLRRRQAEGPYLAGLTNYYHALRPLRFVLDASCGPLRRYLEKLIRPVACRIIPRRTIAERLPEQVVAEEAHFAACIDGDGETCHVLDEQGQAVPAERLLLLLARHLLRENPQGTVVLEEGTAPEVAQAIDGLAGGVVAGGSHRATMAAAMRAQGAVFGGGGSGRFWYTKLGPPLPDALITLTLLLVILSQSDRPLSEVLDGEAAAG